MNDIDDHNIRGADLNLLVAFDALFETRNVSRAAERLNLTQPTVSGMLARLRHMFGDQLFLRTSHGILPTPRAEALAAPVRALLDGARDLLRPDAFDPATETFTLRVCGSDYLSAAAIRPFAAAVLERAPGARVSALSRPARGLDAMLAQGGFDLAFHIRDIARPGLSTLSLFHDRYVCIGREGHPCTKDFLTAEDLAHWPQAFVDPTGNSFRGPVDDWLAELGARRRVVLAVPSMAMLLDLLTDRDLLAFIPERILAGRAGFRRYDTILGDRMIESLAQWHPRYDNDPRHRWFRAVLAEVFGAASGEAR